MVAEILSKNRVTIIILLILISLHLILISTRRIYPFIDIPFRLAASTIAKYYGEMDNQFEEYYQLKSLLKPNMIHLFFCRLPFFSSIEAGNKLFYCIYVILFPVSVFLVIKKLNGNPIFAAYTFLLIYNFNTIWGFSEFTIGIPLTILFFYLLLDYIEKDELQFKIALIIMFFVLFFTHVLLAFFSLFCFFVSCYFCSKSSFKNFLKKVSITIPILITIIFWGIINEGANSEESLDLISFYYKSFWFQKLPERVASIFYLENFSLYKGALGKSVAALFSLFIFIPFIKWLAFHPNQMSIEKNSRIVALNLFLTCSLFCYLFLPFGIRGAYFLYHRFLVFVFVALIFFISVIYKKIIDKTKIFLLLAACFIHLILWADYFVSFEKENRSFTNTLFPELPRDKKLVGLIYDYSYRGRPLYIHFPDYYIVWNKGISVTRLVDFEYGPIGRKVDQNQFPRYKEWVGESNNYRGEYADIDYILVKGEIPEDQKQYFTNFKITKSSGDWYLCERQSNAN